ncbi:MAG: hypothetical protein HBSAPP03_17870 [Phycisphaerae bacterium]|nr:MAG: hypothetical protein HBSAPP03_17870 [Phycisphaerae bacterium]
MKRRRSIQTSRVRSSPSKATARKPPRKKTGPKPGMTPAMRAARNKMIKRLYVNEKLTATQVAERIKDITPSGVLLVLKRMGVKRRQTGSWSPPRPPEYYAIRAYAQRIRDRIGRGPATSTPYFAEAIGVPAERLRAHLRALGGTPRPGRAASITFDEAVRIKAALARDNRSYQSIADEYGISDSTVWAIASGHSWKDAPWPNGKKYAIGGRMRWLERMRRRRWGRAAKTK